MTVALTMTVYNDSDTGNDYNRRKIYVPGPVATLKHSGDAHSVNYFKLMSNILDKDRRYGCRFHV